MDIQYIAQFKSTYSRKKKHEPQFRTSAVFLKGMIENVFTFQIARPIEILEGLEQINGHDPLKEDVFQIKVPQKQGSIRLSYKTEVNGVKPPLKVDYSIKFGNGQYVITEKVYLTKDFLLNYCEDMNYSKSTSISHVLPYAHTLIAHDTSITTEIRGTDEVTDSLLKDCFKKMSVIEEDPTKAVNYEIASNYFFLRGKGFQNIKDDEPITISHDLLSFLLNDKRKAISHPKNANPKVLQTNQTNQTKGINEIVRKKKPLNRREKVLAVLTSVALVLLTLISVNSMLVQKITPEPQNLTASNSSKREATKASNKEKEPKIKKKSRLTASNFPNFFSNKHGTEHASLNFLEFQDDGDYIRFKYSFLNDNAVTKIGKGFIHVQENYIILDSFMSGFITTVLKENKTIIELRFINGGKKWVFVHSSLLS